MTEQEFKQKCKDKRIYYSIALWNAYVDKLWNLLIDRVTQGVYTKPN